MGNALSSRLMCLLTLCGQLRILRRSSRWNSQIFFGFNPLQVLGFCFEVSDFGITQSNGVRPLVSWTNFVSLTFADCCFKEFSETSCGQLNIKAAALCNQRSFCWYLRISHHTLLLPPPCSVSDIQLTPQVRWE